MSERSDDLALEERGLDILGSVTVLRGSICCIRDLAVACTAGMSGLSCQMETFRCGRIEGVCDSLSAVVDPGPDLKQHRGERSPVDRHSRTKTYASTRDLVQHG